MRLLDLACITIAASLAAAGTAKAQATAPATAAPTGTLSVTFTGIDAKQGSIMFGVYDEAGWANEKPLRGQMVDASTSTVTVSIADLPVGRYGVKAFHDINGNGKMDANPFGMPTEPYAFSNNARGAAGPAKWADAAFMLVPGANSRSITIR